jgi:hypothetical protein
VRLAGCQPWLLLVARVGQKF